MKYFTALIFVFITSLSFAQTNVIQNDDFIKAELTRDDSILLFYSMQVEPVSELHKSVKEIQSHDGIVKLQCEMSTLLTSQFAKCFLEVSLLPSREQSTSVTENGNSIVAIIDTFHEAESIFSKFNFDEIRGTHGVARFYFSDDMKVQISCILFTKSGSEEYSCQFGIQK
jgi:hypothetical protein